MKKWVVGVGLLLAVAFALPQAGAQVDKKDKKEEEKKEERKRQRELEEANKEYGERVTGLLKSATDYQIVVTLKNKKGEEQDITAAINENTEVSGLKKDEKLTDVPQGSKVTLAYTHKKDSPFNGTAVGVKLVKRAVEKAEEKGAKKDETTD